MLLAAIGVALTLQLAGIYLPVLQGLLGTEPLAMRRSVSTASSSRRTVSPTILTCEDGFSVCRDTVPPGRDLLPCIVRGPASRLTT
jgi:hypothetical protein